MEVKKELLILCVGVKCRCYVHCSVCYCNVFVMHNFCCCSGRMGDSQDKEVSNDYISAFLFLCDENDF